MPIIHQLIYNNTYYSHARNYMTNKAYRVHENTHFLILVRKMVESEYGIVFGVKEISNK